MSRRADLSFNNCVPSLTTTLLADLREDRAVFASMCRADSVSTDPPPDDTTRYGSAPGRISPSFAVPC
jgi:hypothetical protein